MEKLAPSSKNPPSRCDRFPVTVTLSVTLPHRRCNLILRATFRNLAIRQIERSGARDRNRTGTVLSNRRILSPLRLPIPPPRHQRRIEHPRLFGLQNV